MTIDEFKTLAEAWGGDIARWPPHLRAAAQALAQTPVGMAALDEARRLDRLIATATPEISAERINRALFNVATAIAAVDRPRRRALRAGGSFRRRLRLRRHGGYLARRHASVELVAALGGRDQRAVDHSWATNLSRRVGWDDDDGWPRITLVMGPAGAERDRPDAVLLALPQCRARQLRCGPGAGGAAATASAARAAADGRAAGGAAAAERRGNPARGLPCQGGRDFGRRDGCAASADADDGNSRPAELDIAALRARRQGDGRSTAGASASLCSKRSPRRCSTSRRKRGKSSSGRNSARVDAMKPRVVRRTPA